ncbi:MAG: peptidylprolyl isomerase [Candidatus Aenigmarchaeota archaeon]|nr:peptidylprolyl isomerase [Candidatus Aenigmarchaeota archaeon]
MKTIVVLLILLILTAGCTSANVQDDENTSNDVKNDDIIMENRIAVIQTNHGTMELELFEKKAPITTKNFIDLVNKGFYDNLIFHRVIKDFMIQGGCPDGTGMGGPGYAIKDEFHPELRHSSIGMLSMANSGPNTGGSQFFITLIPTPHLDNHHTVFGKIIKGEDVLKEIGSVQTGAEDRPVDPVTIEKITIKNAD